MALTHTWILVGYITRRSTGQSRRYYFAEWGGLDDREDSDGIKFFDSVYEAQTHLAELGKMMEEEFGEWVDNWECFLDYGVREIRF